MTTAEFNKKLDEQLIKISNAKFLLTSVTAVHSRQVKRIFEQGLNGDGVKIGNYNSSDPLYVNPDDSPKSFPTKGKNGETTFKNGKKHKTGYFDSYKAFRRAISRETGFVNLRLTENLKFDFTNSLTLMGDVYVTGTKKKENTLKADGAINKYGVATFQLTDNEKQIFIESVKLKLKNGTFKNRKR